ncbi:hypothetical protein SPRG_12834 [Saprolegnia parasitica CBS 223.65]|uniref:Uncharacterized protein n=1 Tax=Saprolegnia parasitica (strain CBS 223.65) TaxID=695850 RepID=A0A067BUL0_SAPPC|nr:hypothetical protein SPRG_12834 [Saprolegnia parasitica CBS 223.65]KDO21968.1 hypothetical protein SPRG_12834 [Saprolegnia parasitica CBS 223.65]|eukprot:XP_012207310.1 hypothetical protein SPRG_12834 [Saprolegnia parasitica CBS 223.65]
MPKRRAVDTGPFPPPLRRAGDELVLDPTCPRQTLASWRADMDRNKVTAARRTIYLVPPAILDAPPTSFPSALYTSRSPMPSSAVDRLEDYVRAFYTNMLVKTLAAPALTSWDNGRRYVGLIPRPGQSDSAVRIRTRKAPDGIFPHQLHLDDLLDALLDDVVPDDAYAVLWLVEHDLYEGPDDVFTCGRAYGGSRVALVSSARYDPRLDSTVDGLDANDAWPLGHATCSPAIQAAAIAYVNAARHAEGADIWIDRLCRTVTHELGHCFGIEHCVDFACCMQGSASIAEDYRQPPYVCPLDAEKILEATSSTIEARDAALRTCCRKYPTSPLLSALAAWTEIATTTISRGTKRSRGMAHKEASR